MDDHTLVARAIRGDDRAFSELFEIYFPRLFRFALRRVADEDAAEDIVQSTLVKAMRSLSSWRGEASLFTWLCTLCRHEIHDHWHRLGRSPAIASIDDTLRAHHHHDSRERRDRPRLRLRCVRRETTAFAA
jgi:RNA polymerase sigma-70 factor (ECF subfamily)